MILMDTWRLETISTTSFNVKSIPTLKNTKAKTTVFAKCGNPWEGKSPLFQISPWGTEGSTLFTEILNFKPTISTFKLKFPMAPC